MKSLTIWAMSAMPDQPGTSHGCSAQRHASAATPGNPAVRTNAPTLADIEHWDILHEAVTARLRQLVSKCRAATQDSPTQETVAQFMASILECVEALDQLHRTQRQHNGRRD